MLLNPSLYLGDVAVTECPKFEQEARTLSTRKAPGAIDGRWVLQRQGGPQRDPVLEKLFGSPNQQQTLDIVFSLSGTITGNGPGWGGTGRLNGRNGYLDITFFDSRARGRTDFILDENNVLRGTVRGAGIESYNFIAEQPRQDLPAPVPSSSALPPAIAAGNVSAGAAPTAPPASRQAPPPQVPPLVTPTATVPVGTQLMIRILEPVNLLNPNPATYEAVVERQVVAQGSVIVAAGAAATVRAVRRTQPNSLTNVVFIALTVESIVQDGSSVGITTGEVLKPAPVPGTRYNGAPTLPAQTRQVFTVTR
jgi:hypothetical protein